MEYRSRAVRALVMLHEQRMRSFLPVWKEAQRKNVALPGSGNPSYQSHEALLRHVLGAARGYLVWVAGCLGLPDPGVPEAPPAERIGAEAEGFMETVLAAWVRVHADVEQGQLRDKRYAWHSLEMYVEMMLEHAVVHPERHQFQLEELLRQ